MSVMTPSEAELHLAAHVGVLRMIFAVAISCNADGMPMKMPGAAIMLSARSAK